jgi:transketolase
MRKEFSQWLEMNTRQDQSIVFLTGDLGFQALENVRQAIGPRFINAGVSEQNMISMAAGLAQQGLIPFCYSIAPFAVFRPTEQIRLDVCLHNLNVKIIGNGGGYGYGIMGATHHALEDLAVLSCLQNMRCYVPYSNEDVADTCNAMQRFRGPSYLRLGFGKAPEGIDTSIPWAPVRQLLEGSGLTILGLGPVIINALTALTEMHQRADVFVVSELPVSDWGPAFGASVEKTQALLVVEEHVKRGGLGEHVAHWLISRRIPVRFFHCCALGYPNKRYGSQRYHQAISGLDSTSLQIKIQEVLNA